MVVLCHLAQMNLPLTRIRQNDSEQDEDEVEAQKRQLPQELRAVIEDPNLKKVGSCIGGDFTRLERAYAVHPKREAVVDLGQFGLQCRVLTSRPSLAAMCEQVLQIGRAHV